MTATRIFLIGFMGSGKSSVGKELAKILKYQFIDLDELIEKREKKSISTIFSESGENYFRKIEQSLLQEVGTNNKVVIATGGGCAAFGNNLQLMKDIGATIYLEVQPGILFHRLATEKDNRPLIAKKGDIELMEYIVDKLNERTSSYNATEYKIDASGSIREVARTIEILLHDTK